MYLWSALPWLMTSVMISRCSCARTRLRRGPEVVAADFEQVVDTGQQLGVDGQAGVQLVILLGHQPHGKLVLEHDDGCPEVGGHGQQLEHQRGGDLVWDVGHADVKVGELALHHIPLDDLHREQPASEEMMKQTLHLKLHQTLGSWLPS